MPSGLVRAQDAGGRTRYTMLEPIRQFAHARLVAEGGLDGARARHAAWCVDLAARAGLGLVGPEEGRGQAELSQELANLRAAHNWCLENDPGGAIRIVAELFYCATCASQAEVYAWADATVARWGDGTDPYLAAVFATASWGAWVRGDLPAAAVLAERGVAMARPDVAPRAAVQSWKATGDPQLLVGELARSLSSYDRAIALAVACGEAAEEAISRTARAMALGYLGQTEEACRELAASSTMPAALSPSCRAYADYIAGEARLESAPAEALGYLRRARETCFAVGNTFIGHVAWLSEVSCAARLGDPAEHLDAIADLLEHWRRARAWPQQWITIRALIGALAALGRDEPAAVLLGALTTSPSSTPITGADAQRLDTVVATLTQRLGRDRLAALRADGAALGDEPAVAYALAAARARRLAGRAP